MAAGKGRMTMKEKRYCGKNWDEMNKVLDCMHNIEDRIDLTDEEHDAFDIAIHCVTAVLIAWDD